ncbi:MAG: MFS transporter [Verrucomicrobiales bacterium]|nr:MFS transporter [Verrucomicrobiales bacterium]
MSDLSPSQAAPDEGIANVISFAAFNALSFQMVVGSPMILYAKSLDASATVLGIIAGMLPLLVIFQIPAARFVDAVGYKKFVLSGWSVRTVFVFLLALVPLSAGFLPAESRLALVLLLLFLFNLSRGISSCGWLPWITSIISANRRGTFLTREAMMVNIASFFAFWLAAGLLGGDPAPWRFSVLFFFSAVCAAISLLFLRRIPPEPRVDPDQRPPRPGLSTMLSLRPFRKLLGMNVVWALANGGVLTFLVAWLKEEGIWTEKAILMLTSVTFIGALLNQMLISRGLDRFGSRPILIVGMIVWILLLGLWTAIAGGVISPHVPLVIGLMLILGLAGSMVNLSNLRLVMLSVPDAGRSHYFAIFSVVSSLGLGLAPILWGILIDATATLSVVTIPGFVLNSWSLLFALLAFLFGIAVFLCTRIEEPKSVRWEALMRFMLRQSRARYWLRQWSRSTPRS